LEGGQVREGRGGCVGHPHGPRPPARRWKCVARCASADTARVACDNNRETNPAGALYRPFKGSDPRAKRARLRK
jgi:hypothetical protein